MWQHFCGLTHSGLASVTSVSGADTARATARGNHCKSPCFTCPQSGRKVLISGGSTGTALWSVMSEIISCPPHPPLSIPSLPRTDGGVKRRKRLGASVRGEGWVCVCVFFWCPAVPSLVFVCMSVWTGDCRTAGCISVVRSYRVFLGNRGNKEWKFRVDTWVLWAL